MNRAIILGNLTRDPELKYLPSGTAVVNFGIAHNHRYKAADGTQKEDTNFFDVEAYGRRAEVVAQYFRKGSRILIDGSLKQESWTTAEGAKRSKIVIRMDTFDFIDRGENGNRGEQGYTRPPTERPAPAQPQPKAPELPAIDVDEEDIPF